MVGPELRAKRIAERFYRPARTRGILLAIPGNSYRTTFVGPCGTVSFLARSPNPGGRTTPVAGVLILAGAIKAPARLAPKVDAAPLWSLNRSAAASSLS